MGVDKIPTQKRIAFIGGGAHTIPSYRALLKELAQDYQITLYSEFYLSREWEVMEYTIKSVPPWKWGGRIRDIWFGFMIFFDLLKNPAHIFHSHSTYPSGLAATILGKIFRRPVIISLDAAEATGIVDIHFGDLLHKKRSKINRFVLKHATLLTALTEYHKELVQKNLNPKKEIKVIPRGVDLSKFTYSENPLVPPIRFLNLAYLHPVKDQTTLLKCFAILCKSLDCSLTQVGHDYMNGEMKKLCGQLSISDRVQFIGFVHHYNIHKYYHASHFLIHTSVYESQGMVVAEALASGVLVCGTHVGLLSDLSGLCCITSPPRDPESLANAILQLIQNPSSMNQLRLAGRKWAEDHDLKWTASQYRDLYKQLLY
jgi:glycosyltransferase involved in cell wall biosynthesis